jgi:hypothetical protein
VTGPQYHASHLGFTTPIDVRTYRFLRVNVGCVYVATNVVNSLMSREEYLECDCPRDGTF